ncbi:MAG: hypothetical protein AB7O38_01705 [Pirellulaceae bacterium]
MSRLPSALRLQPLPCLSPCYCAHCKRPLTSSRILDERSAWCAQCRNIVDVACFQVPSWVVGVTVFLAIRLQFSVLT